MPGPQDLHDLAQVQGGKNPRPRSREGQCQSPRIYRLVDAKNPKTSPSRIPLAISCQRVGINIWYDTHPHNQWTRVARPTLFLNGLGLHLGAKLVSTNDRPSTFSIYPGFFSSVGKKTNCAACFCTIWLDVLQGMSVENSRKESKIWPACVQQKA